MALTRKEIVTLDYPPDLFDAAALATALGETEEKPRADLSRVWTHFGPLATWRLLQKTVEVESHGGMLVPDQSRRRTPGGTFFALAYDWARGGNGYAPFRYRPHIPSIARTLIALTDHTTDGECTMKTTLVGTPGALHDCATYVTFTMQKSPPKALPKGLPPPPETPITWTVMIAKKQWAKAAMSLQQTPQTKVIIEGYPCLQDTTPVLLATQCTTVAL